jgi:hypothetical protein
MEFEQGIRYTLRVSSHVMGLTQSIHKVSTKEVCVCSFVCLLLKEFVFDGVSVLQVHCMVVVVRMCPRTRRIA